MVTAVVIRPLQRLRKAEGLRLQRLCDAVPQKQWLGCPFCFAVIYTLRTGGVRAVAEGSVREDHGDRHVERSRRPRPRSLSATSVARGGSWSDGHKNYIKQVAQVLEKVSMAKCNPAHSM